jgi:hypothetical protein
MLISAMPASAHHSFAGQFDPNSSMEIEGELIEIGWANPHAHLKVRTVDKGKVVVWTLETAGASQIEEYDLLRTIHMNQTAGATLVVTTTNVSYPWFDQAGIPQSHHAIHRWQPARLYGHRYRSRQFHEARHAQPVLARPGRDHRAL